MLKSEVIITGFYGTSSESFAGFAREKGYKTLLLSNDKNANAIKIINLVNSFSGVIFSLGQRPNIRNQIHIESCAKFDSKTFKSNVDIEKLEQIFTLQELKTKVSHNAGTSFCNDIFYHGLLHIYDNNLPVKMAFLHIPFEKNIDNSIEFFLRALKGLDLFVNCK